MQFSEIKGQEKAIHILQCAIKNQHIAHAYLFTGPEGVGKKKRRWHWPNISTAKQQIQ